MRRRGTRRDTLLSPSHRRAYSIPSGDPSATAGFELSNTCTEQWFIGSPSLTLFELLVKFHHFRTVDDGRKPLIYRLDHSAAASPAAHVGGFR
jgi:hypothetical protein